MNFAPDFFEREGEPETLSLNQAGRPVTLRSACVLFAKTSPEEARHAARLFLDTELLTDADVGLILYADALETDRFTPYRGFVEVTLTDDSEEHVHVYEK